MNDTLLVYDYPENVEAARDLLRTPRQVLVEATILDVKLTEDMQFGIDWANLETVITGIANASSPIVQGTDYVQSTGGATGSPLVNKGGGLTIGIEHGHIAAFIRAVETVTDVSILANPKILAINKQLGQVYIGTKIGYLDQTTQNDNTTTQSVSFLDTGTKLSFRPYIGNDGYIRMDIHPKDSSGSLNAENIPDETSAELVTNILVKDGETIVIGGLFRDKITAKRTQIPLLGDLPLVGVLFRSKTDQIMRHEVVILLTCHIIEEPGEVDGKERADDIRRKRFGAKDELMPAGRGRKAEDFYASAVCIRR